MTTLLFLLLLPHQRQSTKRHNAQGSLNVRYTRVFLPNLKYYKTKNHTSASPPPGIFNFVLSPNRKQSQAQVPHSVPALTQVHCGAALQTCAPQLLFPHSLILQHKCLKILLSMYRERIACTFSRNSTLRVLLWM